MSNIESPDNSLKILRFLKQTLDLSNEQIKELSHHKTLSNDIYSFQIKAGQKEYKIYGKAEHSEETGQLLRREYDNILNVRHFFSDSEPKYRCVEPIAFKDTVPYLLLLKECQGTSFFDLIKGSSYWWNYRRTTKKTLKAAFECGRWLKTIENNSKEKWLHANVKDYILRSAEKNINRIERLKCMKSITPLIETCRNEILSFFKKTEINELPMYLAHGDYHPENIFVSNNDCDITVIDFQLSKYQMQGYDAVFFEHTFKVSFGALRYIPWEISRILKSFMKGYEKKNQFRREYLRCLKSQIILKSLVYIATRFTTGDYLHRASCLIDSKKLNRWLENT